MINRLLHFRFVARDRMTIEFANSFHVRFVKF